MMQEKVCAKGTKQSPNSAASMHANGEQAEKEQPFTNFLPLGAVLHSGTLSKAPSALSYQVTGFPPSQFLPASLSPTHP